jgi:hypothetical protein
MTHPNWIPLALAASLVVSGCTNISSAQSTDAQPITEWRAYRGTGLPPEWTIGNGVITHTPGGGDIITVESFANVEIAFDWKISPGGNSGVIYRVGEQYGASFQSGPEYQILDNAGHSDGRTPNTTAAAAPFLYAPSRDATLPVGEWNSAKIVLQGNHVEHWLNGELVVSFEIGSDDWKARVANTKFADWSAFGTLPQGHIVLQDHGNPVEYRNFTVRALPG